MQGQRLILGLAGILACAMCLAGDIAGTWSVLENVSDQTYQIQFQKDGRIRLILRDKTEVGTYSLDEQEPFPKLHIKWSNGSSSVSWVRFLAPDRIETYSYRGEATPDFDREHLLDTMTKIEMAPNNSLERTPGE